MASREASTAVGSLAAEDTTNTRGIVQPCQRHTPPWRHTTTRNTIAVGDGKKIAVYLSEARSTEVPSEAKGTFFGGLFCARSRRAPPRSHLPAHRWMLPRCSRSRDIFRFAIFLRYTGPPCSVTATPLPPPLSLSALRLSRPVTIKLVGWGLVTDAIFPPRSNIVVGFLWSSKEVQECLLTRAPSTRLSSP